MSRTVHSTSSFVMNIKTVTLFIKCVASLYIRRGRREHREALLRVQYPTYQSSRIPDIL